MHNFYNWCTNKENTKILVMAGLAILLMIVLKSRFLGDKEVKKIASSTTVYENSIESQGQVEIRGNDEKILKPPPVNSEMRDSDNQKPPSFLTKDLFSFKNPTGNSERERGEMAIKDMELTATIIDGQGALAIINDEVLGIGEFIKGLEVRTIKNNEVALSMGEKMYVLRIKE